VFLVAAGLLGGVCSLFASELPDGLEWSMEKIAGTAEPEGFADTAELEEFSDTTESERAGAVYEISGSVQEATAILPDYSLKGNDTPVGTSLSGILGGAVVIAFCIVLCYVLKLFRKKTGNESLE
ncbi:MAG: PDGLE domain-containing protein, partial [Lachnospiraceae bacterium]